MLRIHILKNFRQKCNYRKLIIVDIIHTEVQAEIRDSVCKNIMT